MPSERVSRIVMIVVVIFVIFGLIRPPSHRANGPLTLATLRSVS